MKTSALNSTVTRDEFLAMLQACPDPVGMACCCLAVLGLRASEIAACDSSWIDFVRRQIKIPPRNAKRDKGRTVHYTGIAVIGDVLQSYFILRKSIGLSRIQIWRRVQSAAAKAGIKHPVTPHGLRASGATWMAQAGASAAALREQFGWSELRTAEHYIEASGEAAARFMQERGGKIL